MAYYRIEDADLMDGHEFEYFCANILSKNGFYNVQVTRGSGDSGADILASKPDISGDITYVIQCKRYSDKVGNKAVQEAHFARSRYNRMIAVVLTNNYFTQQAIEDARHTGVRLWDRTVLERLVCSAYPEESYQQESEHLVGSQSNKRNPENFVSPLTNLLVKVFVSAILYIPFFIASIATSIFVILLFPALICKRDENGILTLPPAFDAFFYENNGYIAIGAIMALFLVVISTALIFCKSKRGTEKLKIFFLCVLISIVVLCIISLTAIAVFC